jgi:hypothetical protein
VPKAANIVEIYLYDVDDLDHPVGAMVAGAILSTELDKRGKPKRWEAAVMGAVRGFGPLLYDLAAYALKARVYPSEDQSSAARRFWARQPKPYIEPMSAQAFEAKYGTTPEALFAQGVDLEAHEYKAMRDHLVDVAFTANQPETGGEFVPLARQVRDARRP